MRLLLCVLLLACRNAAGIPRIVVTGDDTPIRESCEIFIPPGTVIVDANTNGVLHIVADDVTVRFVGNSALRGAPPGTPWDALRGMGIRLDGHRGVTLQDAHVHGYFNGLVASRADGLVVDGGDFSDNYRQRLRSTPAAEDAADWLFPHHNDERRWRDEYGGAVCVEASREVTIRGVRVRRGQNGIILDRVTDSRIYDNDCSFLSGWGVALWRSSRNVLSRNALDFCVRGHVEGVYNRGQDSAGILCFEQSNENVLVENSVTHGGDGFFGFAGQEALGETWMESERQRLRREFGREDVDDRIVVPLQVARDFSSRGCNRNLLMGNDFSYASAHGIEMTFSEGNVLAHNRLVENAICGIWGGYSSDTLIVGNEFARNGGMAYGLERGAINMEHASGNRIQGNTFVDEKCAVHLWWDDDRALLKMPGVAGNDRGVSGNVIAGNSFTITASPPFPVPTAAARLVVLQFRDEGSGHVRDNVTSSNTLHIDPQKGVALVATTGAEPREADPGSMPPLPRAEAVGVTRPVGARASLRGRHQIVLDAWGPWDHETPLIRPVPTDAGKAAWDFLGVTAPPEFTVVEGSVKSSVSRREEGGWRLTVEGRGGVTPFRVAASAPGLRQELSGTLIETDWEVVFFPWKIDPREDLAAWRRLADGKEAVRVHTSKLDFPYGNGGPRDLPALGDLARRAPSGDHFGMVATTRLRLPAGNWKFRTLSDDGVRVRVNGMPVIENWAWHGPTTDEGTYRQDREEDVRIEVEHFEIDGFSVLRLELERSS